MKRILSKQIAMLAVLMMVFAVGCSDDDDDPVGPGGPTDQFDVVTTAGDTYFDDYNTPVTGTGVNITPEAFFTAYSADPTSFYVVDMRSATDFAHVHIDGAVQMSISNLVDEIENLPTDQMILFTCYSGQTASYATSIVNLIGTITGHEARNLKFGASGILDEVLVKADGTYDYGESNAFALDFVTTAAPAKPAAGDFPTVMSEAETALDLLYERARIAVTAWTSGTVRMSPADAVAHDPADVMLINYWSPTAYENGHLENSFQYTPKSSILSTGDLNTLPTDKTVAFYCYTGQTSAQVSAYMTMAGYDARTVMYGVNGMCFEDTNINTVQWHGPESDFTSIFTGPGLAK